MKDLKWRDVKKHIKQQIEDCTSICCDVNTEEKERLVSAAEIRAFESILNLQGEEASIDE